MPRPHREGSPRGRTPNGPPYHVWRQGEGEFSGWRFTWTASRSRWWWLVAVSSFWGGRFVCLLRFPLDSGLDRDRSRWEVRLSKFLERILGPAGKPAVERVVTDAWLAKDCPALHEMLTVTDLGDGKVRQVSTLTIFVEDGLWKGCLNERDQGLTLWSSGDSVEGTLHSLEERLMAPKVDWRRKPQGGRDKPHRQK
jgi:hypothetical protein